MISLFDSLLGFFFEVIVFMDEQMKPGKYKIIS